MSHALSYYNYVNDDDCCSDNDKKDEINDDVDGYDAPCAQVLDIDETCIPDFTSKKNEPMRPGDMMQCWDPIFVSGDKRGLKEASVLSVNCK